MFAQRRSNNIFGDEWFRMKRTNPKKEYGWYCDLCGEKICKYSKDYKDCGGNTILRCIRIPSPVKGGEAFIDHRNLMSAQIVPEIFVMNTWRTNYENTKHENSRTCKMVA